MQTAPSPGVVKGEGATHMQSYHRVGLFSVESNLGIAVAGGPLFRGGAAWSTAPRSAGAMKPVDFQGEDTSLTQDQIGLMR